ncbi:MAG: hypothetical protein GX636_02520 [Actinomycetales bacterium]|nr:hypothetical protein [Actinomycetales bacterium]
MTTTGPGTVPPLPEACASWCRAQPPTVMVADEYVEVDLDLWHDRFALHGIDLLLRGGGPDGETTDTGTAYLRRSDLWAAGRRARGSLEEAVTALYMCAAWLSAHPTRSGITRRFPDFRVPRRRDGSRWQHTSAEGFPLVLYEVVDLVDSPGEALNLLKYGAPWGRGAGGVPDLGYPLASLYLSSLAMAWSDQWIVPVDPAGVGTLIHAGWTEVDSFSRLTPRRFERYQEVVHTWAVQSGVDPLVVEMWLVRAWHERCALNSPWAASIQVPRGRRSH